MTTETEIPLDKRLGSMLGDRLYMLGINLLFFFPFFLSTISDPQLISHQQKTFGWFFTPWFFLGLAGFAIYICKDCINGQSRIKRYYKFQVVDNRSGAVATPLQCVIRNLFCLLWPIEVIVVQFSTSRRIGDWAAGTRLVYKRIADEQYPKIDYKKLMLPYIISLGFLLLLVLPFYSVNISDPKKIYKQDSYNITESKAVEKLYRDSLGNKLVADVRVYDSIPGHRFRYVSIIFRLKNNYLHGYDMLEFKKSVLGVLYSRLPEYSITGEAKFVYQGTRAGLFSVFAQMTRSDQHIGILMTNKD